MRAMTLSAPGKTFLCGEYVALTGGPCIVLMTEPRFLLHVGPIQGNRQVPFPKVKGTEQTPFHKDSPAGKYWSKHQVDLQNFAFDFENPYGVGGFGASSAEFLLLRSFHELTRNSPSDGQVEVDIKSLLNDYQSFFQDGLPVSQPPLSQQSQGQAHSIQTPSGADLVGQACGQVTSFERRAGRIQVFGWPFAHLAWTVFSTGKKLATHEHLGNAQVPNLERAHAAIHRVWESLRRVEEGQFSIGMNEFTQILSEEKLQAEHVVKNLNAISAWSGARAAKGCGAMGSDVVLIVFDQREITAVEIRNRAEELGLKYQSGSDRMGSGVQVDWKDLSFLTEAYENRTLVSGAGA